MGKELPIQNLQSSDMLLLHGDCLQKLKELEANSVDLIFTSPPYAEQRKNQYNSISAENYVKWFSPIAEEIHRVLKKTGSFFLNIASHCEDGERHLYVMDLVIHLKRNLNFKYQDEIVWYKSSNPRRWSYRLKNAWEPIFHFSTGEKPYINHENIKIKTSSAFVDKRGWSSLNELTGNVGGYHEIASQGVGWTLSDNILYFPTSLQVKDKYSHPAKFPIELAEFFVKAYCPPRGLVLDPFAGSGTTCLAALRYNRKTIGIELEQKYIEMIRQRINDPFDPNSRTQQNCLNIFD